MPTVRLEQPINRRNIQSAKIRRPVGPQPVFSQAGHSTRLDQVNELPGGAFATHNTNLSGNSAFYNHYQSSQLASNAEQLANNLGRLTKNGVRKQSRFQRNRRNLKSAHVTSEPIHKQYNLSNLQTTSADLHPNLQKQAVDREQRYYEAISSQLHGAQLSNEPSFLDFNEEQENEIAYANSRLDARKRNNQTFDSRNIRERLREQIRKKHMMQTQTDYVMSSAAKKQSPSMLTNITTIETLKRIDSNTTRNSKHAKLLFMGAPTSTHSVTGGALSSNFERTIAHVTRRKQSSASARHNTGKSASNRKSATVTPLPQQVGRAIRKSELTNKRDQVREEAYEAKVQLEAVKARIFALFKKVSKNYKKSVKRAACRIVQEGRAEQYLDHLSSSSDKLKQVMDAQQEALDAARMGMHVPLRINGIKKENGAHDYDNKSTGTDVQTILLQQETQEVLQHLKLGRISNQKANAVAKSGQQRQNSSQTHQRLGSATSNHSIDNYSLHNNHSAMQKSRTQRCSFVPSSTAADKRNSTQGNEILKGDSNMMAAAGSASASRRMRSAKPRDMKVNISDINQSQPRREPTFEDKRSELLQNQSEEDDQTSGDENNYEVPAKVRVGPLVTADDKSVALGEVRESVLNTMRQQSGQGELLMQTRMMREINTQAEEIRKINSRMFSNKSDSNDMQAYRKKIEVLQEKLRERNQYVIDQKTKAREQNRLKKAYQEVAILRHKMLKMIHKRKIRKRKQAQQAFVQDYAEHMSAMVEVHQAIFEQNKRASLENNSGLNPYNSMQMGSLLMDRSEQNQEDLQQINPPSMFNDLTELSMVGDYGLLDKRRPKHLRRRLTESAKLQNYDTRQNPIDEKNQSDRQGRKRPMTGMILLKRLSRTASITLANQRITTQGGRGITCQLKTSTLKTQTARKQTYDERIEFRRGNNFDLAAADETFNIHETLRFRSQDRRPRIKSATIRLASVQHRVGYSTTHAEPGKHSLMMTYDSEKHSKNRNSIKPHMRGANKLTYQTRPLEPSRLLQHRDGQQLQEAGSAEYQLKPTSRNSIGKRLSQAYKMNEQILPKYMLPDREGAKSDFKEKDNAINIEIAPDGDDEDNSDLPQTNLQIPTLKNKVAYDENEAIFDILKDQGYDD